MKILCATTSNIVHIYKCLKALGIDSDKVSILINSDGLRFRLSTTTCSTALFIKKELFRPYIVSADIEDEDVSFQILMKDFTGVLQMFVNSAHVSYNDEENEDEPGRGTCMLEYDSIGSPLVVRYQETSDAVVCATFMTIDDEEDIFEENVKDLDRTQFVARIIIKGDIMADSIKELISLHTKVLSVRCSSSSDPPFSLISFGDYSTSQLVFPNDAHILETFEVLPLEDENISMWEEEGGRVVTSSYDFAEMAKMKDAFGLASRVALKIYPSGELVIQCLIEAGKSHQSFIKITFLPKEGGS